MDDTRLFVEIMNGISDLNNNMATEVLAKVSQLDYLVEQFAARAELQNNVVKLGGFREVDQTGNVGVVELAHNLHLFENIGALRHSLAQVTLGTQNEKGEVDRGSQSYLL